VNQTAGKHPTYRRDLQRNRFKARWVHLTFSRVFTPEGHREDGDQRPNVCAAPQSHKEGSDGIPSIKTFKGLLQRPRIVAYTGGRSARTHSKTRCYFWRIVVIAALRTIVVGGFSCVSIPLIP
jgi:hypothetical protein